MRNHLSDSAEGVFKCALSLIIHVNIVTPVNLRIKRLGMIASA